jgi:UDP-glucose 4-epimerase
MHNTKSFLVTGAAGFLGSHVVEQLLNKDAHVIGVDNFYSGHRDFLHPFESNPKFKLAELDIRDFDALSELMCSVRPDVVIHLAALHFIPAAIADPTFTVSLNVHGTQSVLTASRLANVETFWFASTGDVYAPSDLPHTENSAIAPFNIYGLTKLMGEQLISLESRYRPDAKFIVGRLFNLYGVRETNPHIIPEIIKQLKEQDNSELHLGNIHPKRDMVPVAEAAKALIATIEKAPSGVNTINMATGVAWSMQELIEVIGKLRRQPIEIKIDPKKVRPVERNHLQADVKLLDQLIGWTPSGNLENGLINLLKNEGLI